MMFTWRVVNLLHEGFNSYIVSLLAQPISLRPPSFSLYFIYLMEYLAGSAIPGDIAAVLSQMDPQMLSVSCGFAFSFLSLSYLSSYTFRTLSINTSTIYPKATIDDSSSPRTMAMLS
jgi:hypothetical protein